jgi:chitodextrinase
MIPILSLFTQPASAWEHTHRVWLPEDFPLKYWVADDGTAPNDPERCEASGLMEGCCEEGVPAGYCAQAAAQGFDAWHAASCAEFEVEYQGVSPNVSWADDGRYQISFNDPGQDIEEGVLAVTYSNGAELAFVLDGQRYDHFDMVDIVFNDEGQFVTHEDAVAERCDEAFNLRSVMTHEIGHSLGMDHSCEDPNKGGAPCSDPVLRAATMYWNETACQPDGADINQDDIEGFTALYGPYATFECSHQVQDGLVIGVVPFDLHCVIVSEDLGEVVSAEWAFGDGGVADELTATHTYTEPGNYTIQLTVQGERETCGEEGWQNNYRRVGYVRACGVPDASFEVDHVDGLQYQMLNDSDVSVYGCISNIQWEVYRGEAASGEPLIAGISAWEPVIDFPEAGTYTVVMNLGGYAGTSGAAVTFEAKDRRGEGTGCGCASSPVGGLGALLLMLPLWRGRRPRR